MNNVKAFREVQIFVRLLEKKLGYELFFFRNLIEKVRIEDGGVGLVYVANNLRAYRFDYLNNRIQSIYVWDENSFGLNIRAGSGNVSLTNWKFAFKIENFGLLRSPDQIVEALTDPKISQYPPLNQIAPRENEEFSVSLSEFFNLVWESLTPDQNISRLTWNEISQIANQAGVDIPKEVRTKVQTYGGEEDKQYDLLTLIDATSKQVNNKEMKANLVRKLIETLHFEHENDNPNVEIEKLEKAVRALINGEIQNIWAHGCAGVGKRHTVRKVLEEHGYSIDTNNLFDRYDVEWFRGVTSPFELYKRLFRIRKKKIIVFEETDYFWSNRKIVELVKSALNTDSNRVVSWKTSSTVDVSGMSDERKTNIIEDMDEQVLDVSNYDRFKYPSEFPIKSKIICNYSPPLNQS